VAGITAKFTCGANVAVVSDAVAGTTAMLLVGATVGANVERDRDLVDGITARFA